MKIKDILAELFDPATTVFVLDKPKEEPVQISEITKLQKSDYEITGTTPFWVSDDELKRLSSRKKYPISGQDNLYLVIDELKRSYIQIYAFDTQSNYPVGSLILKKNTEIPIRNSYEVDTIGIKRPYRGKGIAQAMYRLVMSKKSYGMGATLIAGESQTPSGRKNWVRLANDPNIEVLGWAIIRVYNPANLIASSQESEQDRLYKTLDDLYGKLGAQHLAVKKGNLFDKHYFVFPISVGKSQIVSAVKNSSIKIYHGDDDPPIITGLLARWQA